MSAADGEQIIEKLHSKNLISTLAQVVRRRHAQNLTAVVRQRESYFRVRQCVVSYQICEMKTLCSFRPQKLSPRRDVEEEITDNDGRTAGMRRIFDVPHLAPFD